MDARTPHKHVCSLASARAIHRVRLTIHTDRSAWLAEAANACFWTLSSDLLTRGSQLAVTAALCAKRAGNQVLVFGSTNALLIEALVVQLAHIPKPFLRMTTHTSSELEPVWYCTMRSPLSEQEMCHPALVASHRQRYLD
jgi:hypothetical protein